MSKSALDRQEGGDHYKRYAIEPVEFCHRNNLSWCQANVVKYVVRFKDKGGAADLAKARHYLDMLEEFEYGKKEPTEVQEAKPASIYYGEAEVEAKDKAFEKANEGYLP